jgi:hypothetical protein
LLQYFANGHQPHLVRSRSARFVAIGQGIEADPWLPDRTTYSQLQVFEVTGARRSYNRGIQVDFGKANMKTVQWIAASLVTLASVSALAAAGGNGGGNGGAGGSGGAGHGGLGGNAGGMSAGHMSSKGLSNTNGFSSGDRDAGLARAADRSDTQADRADAQTSHKSLHAAHTDQARSHARARVNTKLHHSQHIAVSHST